MLTKFTIEKKDKTVVDLLDSPVIRIVAEKEAEYRQFDVSLEYLLNILVKSFESGEGLSHIPFSRL